MRSNLEALTSGSSLVAKRVHVINSEQSSPWIHSILGGRGTEGTLQFEFSHGDVW